MCHCQWEMDMNIHHNTILSLQHCHFSYHCISWMCMWWINFLNLESNSLYNDANCQPLYAEGNTYKLYKVYLPIWTSVHFFEWVLPSLWAVQWHVNPSDPCWPAYVSFPPKTEQATNTLLEIQGLKKQTFALPPRRRGWFPWIPTGDCGLPIFRWWSRIHNVSFYSSRPVGFQPDADS